MFVSNENALRNAGLMLGAGVAAGGLVYYLTKEEMDGVPAKEVETRRRVKSAYGYVLGGFAITGASAMHFAKPGYLS